MLIVNSTSTLITSYAIVYLLIIFLYYMNIFIAGLSYNINDEDLKNLFNDYGEPVSAKVIMDRATGRSKGYGFVELEDDEAAKKAIEELDGAEFDGKKIAVSEAKPKEEGDRPRRNFSNNNNRRGGGGGGDYRKRDQY